MLFTGLAACEQAENVMDEVTQSAEQAVDKAKDKAVSMLEGSEEEKQED